MFCVWNNSRGPCAKPVRWLVTYVRECGHDTTTLRSCDECAKRARDTATMPTPCSDRRCRHVSMPTVSRIVRA